MEKPYVIVVFIACAWASSAAFRCFPDRPERCDGNFTRGLAWDTSARFFLFTRRRPPQRPELLHACGGSLPRDSTFDPRNDVVVFIQGYALGICELDAIAGIKNELLERGDFNVIVPECSKAYGFFYRTAVDNMPKVADAIVQVLRNIQHQTGISNNQIYLIGISLGAQTAGVVGSRFPVRRITGLDPVRMSFGEDTPPELRLDPGDAPLVDVIHCNGGTAFPFVAIDYPAGDADFYVNGGSKQPVCTHDVWQSIKKLKFWYAFGVAFHNSICSHAQCLEYYRLSVNHLYGNFTAWACDSYGDLGLCRTGEQPPVLMGFDFERFFTPLERRKPFPRRYFLEIGDRWPYVSRVPSRVRGNELDIF